MSISTNLNQYQKKAVSGVRALRHSQKDKVVPVINTWEPIEATQALFAWEALKAGLFVASTLPTSVFGKAE